MSNELLPFLFERGQVFLKDDGEIIFIRAVFNRENDKKIEAVSEHGYIYSFYESRSPALRLYTSADKAAPVERIDHLKTALMNAVTPFYEEDKAEWVLYCGGKESAVAILQAARAYLKLQGGE